MPTPDSWPTEALATQAVDQAARAHYERVIAPAAEANPEITFSSYDDLSPQDKLALREAVLPIVWAALTGLPDPRYAAWEEGAAAGSSNTAFECEGSGTDYQHIENPYPSGV